MDILKWDDTIKRELKDDAFAEAFLKAALESYKKDHNVSDFLHALRTLIHARGKFSDVAKKAKISREHLYKILSQKGNPTIDSLMRILTTLNFRKYCVL